MQRTPEEHYFSLRQQCRELKELGYLFEGIPWIRKDSMYVRRNAGHELRIYRIENDMECCVIYPNGTSQTFAEPIKSE